ncbi:uridylate kinase [Morchella snyderi]|nr:uridylate kinase [Morchella snyderi]
MSAIRSSVTGLARTFKLNSLPALRVSRLHTIPSAAAPRSPTLPTSRINPGSFRQGLTHSKFGSSQGQCRLYAAGPRNLGETGGSKNPFPVVPLVLIFTAGSGGFYLLVNSRKDTMPATEKTLPRSPKKAKTTPTFSPKDVSVIFVLGGPGAGKGTQCQNLVRDYGFVHLSAGDLLRAEQNRAGSEFGELIKTYIREGRIVPMEVTVALLENAMKECIANGQSRFLIDGFPREMDQAIKFETEVCPSVFTLFFDCPEEVMLQRLLKRGETSGREDDNIESIKKRFRTFVNTSMPVVDMFEKEGKVVRVDCTQGVEEVYSAVKKEVSSKFKPMKERAVMTA